jgi:transcriptional regulator with XRE-family HTH domain
MERKTLRSYRRRQDMTLRQIARRAGVSVSVIGLIEAGYWHRRRDRREHYARAYGLTLEDYEARLQRARARRARQ